MPEETTQPRNSLRRRSLGRRLSFSGEVGESHDEDARLQLSCELSAEPQLVKLGLLRLGNVYRKSLVVPVEALSVEVLPFLSTSLEASIVSESSGRSLVFTFAAQREGRFSENLSIRVDFDGLPSTELTLRIDGGVMGREDGKPLARRGVQCISEGRPEDFDTEDGYTTWEGFRRGGMVVETSCGDAVVGATDPPTR